MSVNDAFRNLMSREDLLRGHQRHISPLDEEPVDLLVPKESAEVPPAQAEVVTAKREPPSSHSGMGEIDLNVIQPVYECHAPALPEAVRGEYEGLWRRMGTLRLTPPSVLMTSCVHGEGVTTSAINLARCAGAQDSAVIVVDLDFERSGASSLVPEAQSGPDLASVLRGDCRLIDAIRFVEPERFFLLSLDNSGEATPSILQGRDTDALLEKLHNSFDLVIYDTPPCLYVESASIMAGKSGGVILMARQGGHDKKMLQKAVEKMDRVGANVLGMVQTFM